MTIGFDAFYLLEQRRFDAEGLTEGGFGEPRRDGRSSQAYKHSKGVHIEALGGLNIHRCVAAQALALQMRVQGGDAQGYGQGCVFLVDSAVGDEKVAASCAHSFFGLPAQTLDRLFQSFAVSHILDGKGCPQRRCNRVEHRCERSRLSTCENGRWQLDDATARPVRVGKIGKVADTRPQVHNALLAQRIDRRVRYLREVLTKEVVERSRVFDQHRQRRVVAHRSCWLDSVLRHGFEYELDLLKGPPQRRLTTFQAQGIDFFCSDGFQSFQRTQRASQLAVGTQGGAVAFELVVATKLSFLQVDGKHGARSDMPFLDDGAVVQRHDSCLRSSDQQPVVCDRIAQGTQSVSVHTSQYPSSVEGADGCRSVPRFHQAVVPPIEVAQRLRHTRVLRIPSLGHEQASRLRQFSSETQQHFEGSVDTGRIRSVQGQDGFDLGARVAQSMFVAQLRLVARHPTTISL